MNQKNKLFKIMLKFFKIGYNIVIIKLVKTNVNKEEK